MKSLTTSEFWCFYRALRPQVREQARKAYQLWVSDQFHPALHFKKVSNDLWSVRISGSYRALALKKGEDYYWIWIGSHHNYEALIS